MAKFLLLLSQFFTRCLAALDLGADVEQPVDCLIVQSRQAMQSMGRSMDWALEDNMVYGLFFCDARTGSRGGNTPFVQTGVLCAPFFTSCEAIEFAETGHRREERPDLPVSLLMVLHALRVSAKRRWNCQLPHRSSFFGCSRDSRDEAALSVSVPTGSGNVAIERLALFVSAWRAVLRRSRGMHCLASNSRLSQIPGMPSKCLLCPEVEVSQRIHLREGKRASNQPCESFNASPDYCGQEPWVLVVF